MSVGRPYEGAEIFRVVSVEFVVITAPAADQPLSGSRDIDDLTAQLASLRKLLNSGTFFFGVGYDVSCCQQRLHAAGRWRRADAILQSLKQQERLRERRQRMCDLDRDWDEDEDEDDANNPAEEQDDEWPEGCRRISALDRRFVWNMNMLLPFARQKVDVAQWATPVIRGGVVFRTIYAGAHQVRLGVISRISSERAGKRLITRGVDDDGNVANFVETEQLVIYGERLVSFVQTRGSVPVFWEQPGLQIGSHKVRLSRSYEAACPAFERHFRRLERLYGSVFCVNLLGHKDSERMLTEQYKRHVDDMMRNSAGSGPPLSIVSIDFHQNVKDGGLERLQQYLEPLQSQLNTYGLFEVAATGNASLAGGSASLPAAEPGSCTDGARVLSEQTGVLRVNCLDCLDRTNVVQMLIGQVLLQQQLKLLGLGDAPSLVQRFGEQLRAIWVDNGDAVSYCYTGTGALKSDMALKNKRTKTGAVLDAAKSVSRTLQNSFFDAGRQEAIDVLLGNDVDRNFELDRLSGDRGDRGGSAGTLEARVASAMATREAEFTSTKQLHVYVGTWNVNGKRRDPNDPLDQWLLPSRLTAYPRPDLYVVGFQEVVDLTASNIVAADESNRVLWEEAIGSTINGAAGAPHGLTDPAESGRRPVSESERESEPADGYVLLVSQQLVGVCMCIFVRSTLLPSIRDVVIGKHKTGMRGMAGNKGAVAIRLRMYDTAVCFVCAHLAAGQTNVAERNADYANITRSVSFRKGRSIETHACVVWFGDFNYRIDMQSSTTRDLARSGDYRDLLRHDQLRCEMECRRVFVDYREGEITFAPTYKYDLNRTSYDSSEKARPPAWCDRILFRAADLRLLHYDRAELMSSDHRPVYALFQLQARVVNRDARRRIKVEVLKSIGAFAVTVQVQPVADDVDPDELMALLEPFGEALSIRHVGGVVYLVYPSMDVAQKVLKLNGSAFAGKSLQVALKPAETGAYEGVLVDLGAMSTGSSTPAPVPESPELPPIDRLCDRPVGPAQSDGISTLSAPVQPAHQPPLDKGTRRASTEKPASVPTPALPPPRPPPPSRPARVPQQPQSERPPDTTPLVSYDNGRRSSVGAATATAAVVAAAAGAPSARPSRSAFCETLVGSATDIAIAALPHGAPPLPPRPALGPTAAAPCSGDGERTMPVAPPRPRPPGGPPGGDTGLNARSTAVRPTAPSNPPTAPARSEKRGSGDAGATGAASAMPKLAATGATTGDAAMHASVTAASAAGTAITVADAGESPAAVEALAWPANVPAVCVSHPTRPEQPEARRTPPEVPGRNAPSAQTADRANAQALPQPPAGRGGGAAAAGESGSSHTKPGRSSFGHSTTESGTGGPATSKPPVPAIPPRPPALAGARRYAADAKSVAPDTSSVPVAPIAGNRAAPRVTGPPDVPARPTGAPSTAVPAPPTPAVSAFREPFTSAPTPVPVPRRSDTTPADRSAVASGSDSLLTVTTAHAVATNSSAPRDTPAPSSAPIAPPRRNTPATARPMGTTAPDSTGWAVAPGAARSGDSVSVPPPRPNLRRGADAPEPATSYPVPPISERRAKLPPMSGPAARAEPAGPLLASELPPEPVPRPKPVGGSSASPYAEPPAEVSAAAAAAAPSTLPLLAASPVDAMGEAAVLRLAFGDSADGDGAGDGPDAATGAARIDPHGDLPAPDAVAPHPVPTKRP